MMNQRIANRGRFDSSFIFPPFVVEEDPERTLVRAAKYRLIAANVDMD
jgi:hypothetical protein